MDPKSIDLSEWENDNKILFIPEAGEVLYRLSKVKE